MVVVQLVWVKWQIGDCVLGKLLVTFFRPMISVAGGVSRHWFTPVTGLPPRTWKISFVHVRGIGELRVYEKCGLPNYLLSLRFEVLFSGKPTGRYQVLMIRRR